MQKGYGAELARQPIKSVGHSQMTNLARVHKERHSWRERLRRLDESPLGRALRLVSWGVIVALVPFALFGLPLAF